MKHLPLSSSWSYVLRCVALVLRLPRFVVVRRTRGGGVGDRQGQTKTYNDRNRHRSEIDQWETDIDQRQTNEKKKQRNSRFCFHSTDSIQYKPVNFDFD
jgi:hypothetical protein